MAEERTRRLPRWLAIDNGETKKKTAEDPEELPTRARKSVSLAKKEQKRKRGNPLQHSESSNTGANVGRGNKRKQNAKTIPSPPTHDHIEDEDEDEEDLTVDDLVSIAQEYVKVSEDSELLSRNGEPSCSNAVNESREQRFSSWETRGSSGFTVDLTGEQNFVRTDDPVLDMLRLYLGPLP